MNLQNEAQGNNGNHVSAPIVINVTIISTLASTVAKKTYETQRVWCKATFLMWGVIWISYFGLKTVHSLTR